MKTKTIFLILQIILLAHICSAQQLIGPIVVGGVDHNSATFYARFDQAIQQTLYLTETPGSLPPGSMFSLLDPDPNKDLSATTSFDGLNPDTEYFYWLSASGISQAIEIGSFRTFPLPYSETDFTFVYGSCINNFSTDSIFNQISETDPAFVIIGGDWGYPDVTDDLPNDPTFFATNIDWVRNSYADRYSSIYFSELASRYPIDYVYDDHDFMNNNASGSTVTWIDFSLPDTLVEVDIPVGARTNIINGYRDHFPHYELPNFLKGIYHSFEYGDAEFFILDTRSNRSPISEGMYHNGTEWVFEPSDDRTLLGEEQMDWLLTGLSNSSAHWKFIVSSVVFNQKYEIFRDSLLTVASSTPALESLAIEGAFATLDSWSGYEADQDKLLNYIDSLNVENIILLSGDSHTGAIDDGINSGLPELMAANLNQTNSQLAYFMQSLGGIELWNQGGQGLGNTNFNNIFGNIEVFGNDSVCLNVIDQNDVVVARYCKTSCDDLNESSLGLIENLSCFNSGDGSIQGIQANGGLGDIEYSFNGGTYSTVDSFFNLSADTYTINIKDEIGCIGEIDVDVLEPSLININLIVQNEGELTSGSGEVMPSGGTPPYQINWMDDSGAMLGSLSFLDLPPGDYSVLVEDVNECSSMEQFSVDVFNSINDIKKQRIQIFNEPAYWNIYIDSRYVNEIRAVQIYDTNGRFLEDIREIENEILVRKANFNAGNYILRISWENEELSSFKLYNHR